MYNRNYTFTGSPIEALLPPPAALLTHKELDELMHHLATFHILLRYTLPLIKEEEVKRMLLEQGLLLEDFVDSKGWVKVLKPPGAKPKKGKK